MNKNIIFDLDGTLVDSAGDIIACLNYAYSFVPELAPQKIDKTVIGPPVDGMAKHISPNINDKQIQIIVSRYRECYDKSNLSKTRLYAGAEKLLKKLTSNGCTLYLVTNKPKLSTYRILNKFSIDTFKEIVTPDSIPGKVRNKVEMVSHLIEIHALDRKATVIVGDTETDVQAGQKNGIITAVVLSGYGTKESLKKSKPDHIFNSLIDAEGLGI
jgi:phosphoglycolate phosphatase